MNQNEHLSNAYTWRDAVEARIGGLQASFRAHEQASSDIRHDLDAQAAKIDSLAVMLTNKIDTTFGALRADMLAAQTVAAPRGGGASFDWKVLFVLGVVIAGGIFGAGWMMSGGSVRDLERTVVEQAG